MCRHSITRPLQSVFRNRKPAFWTPRFLERICTVLIVNSHPHPCFALLFCSAKFLGDLAGECCSNSFCWAFKYNAQLEPALEYQEQMQMEEEVMKEQIASIVP